MITEAHLRTSILEAYRYIDKALALTNAMKKPGVTYQHSQGPITYPPSIVKEHAACKRSSMDLTRALAALRKGDV